MYFFTLFGWYIIQNTYATLLTDVCNNNFQGDPLISDDPLCLEYGFCSSCVAHGCNWCSLTNRCLATDNDCGYKNMFGLSSSTECTNEYNAINKENPDRLTTNYSPKISEIMAIYSRYVYDLDEDPDFSVYDTFNLEDIKTFTKDVKTIPIQSLPFIKQMFGTDTTYDADIEAIMSKIKTFVDNPLVGWVANLLRVDVVVDHIIDFFDDTLKLDIAGNTFGENRVLLGVDHKSKAIVVAFRGTEDKDNDNTLISEILWGWLIKWDESEHKSSISELRKALNVDDVKVWISQYFSAAYNTLKFTEYYGKTFYEHVKDYIAKYSEYELFVTGHSLGGSLANIFVLDLYADYYNDVSLQTLSPSKFKIYTFGQARAGNEGFVKLVNAIFNYEYYRVIHGTDIVSQIPPWIFSYRHNGIEIHYGEGDYYNKVMCQYRECTHLDPYEDVSCRARYETVDYDDIDLLGSLDMAGQIVDYYHFMEDLFTNGFDSLKDFKGSLSNAPGGLGDAINLYMSNDILTDHSRYKDLGFKGHCNNGFSTSVNSVKCNDFRGETSSAINKDSYQCLSIWAGIYNVLDHFGWNGITDKFNGCENAGNNMNCCPGTPGGGPFTVCKPKEGSMCPYNGEGDYCWDSTDCKGGICRGGVCLGGDGSCDEYSKITYTSNQCAQIEDEWNLGIRVGDSLYAKTDSQIMFSYCIINALDTFDCSDWYKLDHSGHDDFAGKCRWEYFIIPGLNQDITNAMNAGFDNLKFEFKNCGTDGILVDQLQIGHNGIIGYIDEFNDIDGVNCHWDKTDERSFTVDDTACPQVSIAVDWSGNTIPSHSTMSSVVTTEPPCNNNPGGASALTKCQTKGVTSDGSCSSFFDLNNKCSRVKTDWNLGIGLGAAYHAKTDDLITFSYCINDDCSDWYALDHCNYDDYTEQCSMEHFIVPDLTQDITAAFTQSDTNEIYFQFQNCGSDGIVIDRLTIGHDAEFGIIDTFNKDGSDSGLCTNLGGYKGIGPSTFIVDSDCATVSVQITWSNDDMENTDSSISSSLHTDEVNTLCQYNPGCADESRFSSRSCEVKAAPKDTSCRKYSESTNDCDGETNWNLGITTGSHKYAGTDSPILFSYCIDIDCSNWYALNNCDHNDYRYSCNTEWFIIPQLTDEMNSVSDQDGTTFKFRLINCGRDGLQIDQMSIGYDSEFGNIYSFESGDQNVCRFSTTNSHTKSFAIDKDRCQSVFVTWLGGTETSATITKSDMTATEIHGICSDFPECAGDKNNCQTQTSTTIPIGINNIMIFSGLFLMVSLIVLTLLNIHQCRNDKIMRKDKKVYLQVNVESSLSSTEE